MNLRARLLAPLLLAVTAAAQSNPLPQAVELFQQGRYDEALTQFESARRLHPNDAAVDNFIGITETRLGRIDAANHDYELAQQLDPRLPGPYKGLGFNYLGRAQYEQAESVLHKALALDGADPYVHYYLVLVYLATARAQQAVAQIESAETLLVNDPANAFAAVVACIQSHADKQGLQLLDALEQRSALSSAQEFELAELFNGRALYSEAAECFRRIARLEPGSWQNQANLALALVRAKREKEALPLLAALTAEHASNASLMSSVASSYEAAGEASLALSAYHKAIAAEPANPDRFLDASRLLMEQDRYEEATALVNRGVAQVTDDYPLIIRLGAIEMMAGRHEAARGYYRKAIAEHPAVALGYVALAQSFMKDGNDREALQSLTEGRAAVGLDFALEYVFGLVTSSLGQPAQALAAFQQSVALNPDVVEPHYQLGILYMKQQQWSPAKEEFDQVLRIDPHHAGAYYQLSRVYQRLGQVEKARATAKQAAELNRSQHEASAVDRAVDRVPQFGPG